MLFAKEQGFADLIENITSKKFLKETADKYHYLEENLPELQAVAEKMQESIFDEAAFEIDKTQEASSDNRCRGVVMTLGEGLDRLQDSYTEKGFLTESYMVEALGSEILLRAYAVFNRWVEETMPYHVAKYFFLGSEENYPLERLPVLLTDVSLGVRCNASYFMMPKKSVAFYALLTREEGVYCKGICESCQRTDCQNRSKTESLLPYGYARILGRMFR